MASNKGENFGTITQNHYKEDRQPKYSKRTHSTAHFCPFIWIPFCSCHNGSLIIPESRSKAFKFYCALILPISFWPKNYYPLLDRLFEGLKRFEFVSLCPRTCSMTLCTPLADICPMWPALSSVSHVCVCGPLFDIGYHAKCYPFDFLAAILNFLIGEARGPALQLWGCNFVHVTRQVLGHFQQLWLDRSSLPLCPKLGLNLIGDRNTKIILNGILINSLRDLNIM